MTDMTLVREAVHEWMGDTSSPVDYSALRNRFWSFTKTANPPFKSDGCVRWQGSHDNKGYGIFTVKGVMLKAHRVAVRLGSGTCMPQAVLPTLTVDHVRDRGCLHNDCVNPYHLELVSNSVNGKRKRDFLTFT